MNQANVSLVVFDNMCNLGLLPTCQDTPPLSIGAGFFHCNNILYVFPGCEDHQKANIGRIEINYWSF